MVEKDRELEKEQQEQAPDSLEEGEEGAAVPVEEQAPAVEDVEALVEDLRQQLEAECRRSAEYNDQWLRAVAELRNYKKRVQQEQEQRARETNAVLIAQLLPVVDDFERALASLPDAKLAQLTWVEGILLIYRRLRAILEQNGLRAIEAEGQPFDPYFHDAILYEEVPAEQDQLVLAELQKGYKLHDRVLRPSLVKVGCGVAAPEAAAEAVPAAAEPAAAEDEAAPAEEQRPAEET